MKSIPIALQTHYNGDATTTCYLLRILTKSGVLLGFASLDADVTYNPATVDPYGTGDAWGVAVHRADNGFTPERMQESADLTVDNTDLRGWVSDSGVTEAQIRAGLFDYAAVRLYRVNYLDLSAGHELVAAGTLGETKFSAHSWKTEFRSLTQQLKQPICKVYSRTCRAKFDDAKCGKAFTWVSGTVTSIDGTEPDRIFTATALTQADGYFVPGVVEWLTGANAGAQMEVDAFTSGVVTLTLPLAYPIAAGDTFRIRQDCDKTFAMCKERHANTLKFRGEHLTPSDGGQSMVPGADIERA